MNGAIIPPGGNGFRRNSQKDTRIIRLIVFNWIAGAVLGLGVAAALILMDVAGIGSLIWRSSNATSALALLAGGFALTFASLVAGTAIMLVPKNDSPHDPPDGLGAAAQLAPARAVAKARRP
ncbi:MAG: hypothetical protein FJX29_02940 [Alphaproteobacteria bacterium]|nr:hypothetical protein [Alphaproteobacteria bacterium]